MRQILGYLIVGVLTLVIDVLVTSISFYYLHLQASIASGIGFMSGFFFNFPMNRNRVFRHADDAFFKLPVQIVLFVSYSLFNLVATSLAVEWTVNLGTNIALAKVLVTAASTIVTFSVLRFGIFRSRKQH